MQKWSCFVQYLSTRIWDFKYTFPFLSDFMHHARHSVLYGYNRCCEEYSFSLQMSLILPDPVGPSNIILLLSNLSSCVVASSSALPLRWLSSSVVCWPLICCSCCCCCCWDCCCCCWIDAPNGLFWLEPFRWYNSVEHSHGGKKDYISNQTGCSVSTVKNWNVIGWGP